MTASRVEFPWKFFISTLPTYLFLLAKGRANSLRSTVPPSQMRVSWFLFFSSNFLLCRFINWGKRILVLNKFGLFRNRKWLNTLINQSRSHFYFNVLSYRTLPSFAFYFWGWCVKIFFSGEMEWTWVLKRVVLWEVKIYENLFFSAMVKLCTNVEQLTCFSAVN